MPYASETVSRQIDGYEVSVVCIQHRADGPWEYEVAVHEQNGAAFLPPVRSRDGGKPTLNDAVEAGMEQGRLFIAQLRR